MFKKVKTPQDLVVLIIGFFTIFAGLTAGMAIAALVVKVGEELDKLLF